MMDRSVHFEGGDFLSSLYTGRESLNFSIIAAFSVMIPVKEPSPCS
jgi:hypothetical protein